VNEKFQGLTEQYAFGLEHYLAKPQEAGLMRAYELGRRALELAMGMADLSIIHGQALAQALRNAGTPDERACLTCRAAEFLGESMAPFEMALRGYREANDLLQRLNETLEQRVKERTAEMEESEERYRDLFENAGDLIYAATPDGRLLFVNRAWRINLGYTDDDLSSLSLGHIVHHEQRNAFLEVCRRALAGERLDRVETVFVAKHGRALVVEGSVNGQCVEGRPVATRGIFRDITERKRMEEELIQVARRKDEFLAMLAHELRNPLAPIRNALQIVRLAKHDSPAFAEARDMMERQVQNLVRLIDDLMDVSRISRGKIELKKERMDLGTILKSAIEISRAQIEAARHELTVTLPPNAIWVQADQTRLAQVVANLLNNAAKYTEPGGRIWLNAERDGVKAVIRVRDTGIGIPSEMLPHIFDIYVQVSTSLDRSQGGLGLGLTLVKRLVELHNGSVEVFSAGPHQGSEFVVRLPIATDDGEASDRERSSRDGFPLGGSTGLRVLIVDDNRDSAESLAMLLELAGHRVRVALDGPSAIETALDFQPRILLLDIEMPDMSGYEVAQRIREQPITNKALLVAMTGYATDSDRRQCKEAGFDHHLVKPVDFEALQQLLASLGCEP
jgi:PAS domain S-box-containing protein